MSSYKSYRKNLLISKPKYFLCMNESCVLFYHKLYMYQFLFVFGQNYLHNNLTFYVSRTIGTKNSFFHWRLQNTSLKSDHLVTITLLGEIFNISMKFNHFFHIKFQAMNVYNYFSHLVHREKVSSIHQLYYQDFVCHSFRN